MNSWRDYILKDFVPNVGKLTLVADPDGLLTEEKLAIELRRRGFDLIEFHDPVEFRYAYESKYRVMWDEGQQTDLVVILRMPEAELDSLPYDLLQAGRKLFFNLGDLFPGLSYPVLEDLDRGLLDDIFTAQQKVQPDILGDNATKDFILRNVFGIVTELVTTEVELLRALLRVHYKKIKLPEVLADRFVDIIGSQAAFKDWPLREIVQDQQNFLDFLQERWPVFLNRLAKPDHAWQDANEYGHRFPGPDTLPFDHHDIRVYIDSLFVEGRLEPVKVPNIEVSSDSWFRCGVIEEDQDTDIRFSRLFSLVQEELPDDKARHHDWISFAMKWAELSALVHGDEQDSYRSQYQALSNQINQNFSTWLKYNFAGLISLSPSTPAMVHHIPRLIARETGKDRQSKAALIVVDGLSLDQWVTVGRIIQEQDKNLVIRESAVFAWVPTLTSVSRQAVFSGKPPIYFPASINSTSKEITLWRQFWEEAGISRLQVAYQKGLGDGSADSILDPQFNPEVTRVAGLVVDKVDKIMHGMQLGASGMHSQIMLWCRDGFLSGLIGYLLDHGYDVWLTSDHGNIECRGKGKPKEGVIAETRGQRARVYPSQELRSRIGRDYSSAIHWDPVGLPPEYFPLVLSGEDAFVQQDKTIVGHGGISIEEVIVPFIKFERRSS
ncbi:BREX-3 system phosphatase PglZ [Desulfonatronovibrio magnus]|uniref:BREX-3 system phosphatase PglZ n=1 Tax=Desulfonatronovibrio magnus TaxID=698827 RepID=UPI0005EAE835|nr:BREX-3 system phosphatase PglZ [Desulfonatronovibrio magnus]